MEIILFVFVAAITLGIIIGLIDYKAGKAQSTALAAISGFNPAVTYSGGLGKAGLAIDPAGSKFAIIHLGQQPKVFDFSQLVAVEVDRNGSSITKSNRGSQAAGAAVGAVLLGPIGLLIGGVTGSKRQIEKVYGLTLKVYTNDIINPVHNIVFFNDRNGAKPDGFLVKSAAHELDKWYGRFRTILEMQANHHIT